MKEWFPESGVILFWSCSIYDILLQTHLLSLFGVNEVFVEKHYALQIFRTFVAIHWSFEFLERDL